MATTRDLSGSTAGIGSSTVRLSVTNVPDATGSVPSPPSDIPPILNTKSGFGSQFLTLSSGANTVTVPANVVGFILIPPSGNATSITFKGLSADTGVLLAPNGVQYITLAASVTSFVLTTGGSIAGVEFQWQ